MKKIFGTSRLSKWFTAPRKPTEAVKHQLREIAKFAFNHEEGLQVLDRHKRFLNSADGLFLRDSLLLLQGNISDYLLSDEFTELDEREKDITQRSLKQCNELCSYILDPLGYIDGYIKIKGSQKATKGE